VRAGAVPAGRAVAGLAGGAVAGMALVVLVRLGLVPGLGWGLFLGLGRRLILLLRCDLVLLLRLRLLGCGLLRRGARVGRAIGNSLRCEQVMGAAGGCHWGRCRTIVAVGAAGPGAVAAGEAADQLRRQHSLLWLAIWIEMCCCESSSPPPSSVTTQTLT
jgi:hypothetical protein